MKPIILILTLFSLLACNNDDYSGKDNGGNTFSATFDGQTIEPRFISSGVTGAYTFYVNRYWENNNSWKLKVNTESDLYLSLFILNINGIGTYPIETANLEDWTNVYSKTCIFLEDGVTAQFSFLSLGNTGSFEITRYDSERGILEGSFSCDMYDPQHSEIIRPITGSFKINMETHPNYN